MKEATTSKHAKEQWHCMENILCAKYTFNKG